MIDARIRETTDYASVLFFIAIDDPTGSVRPVFYSTNLRGMPIPDVPGCDDIHLAWRDGVLGRMWPMREGQ
jgi:hypothetical protein